MGFGVLPSWRPDCKSNVGSVRCASVAQQTRRSHSFRDLDGRHLMRTTILTLLLLFPVCSFANTDVVQSSQGTTRAATAQQKGTQDVEAEKSSVPTIMEESHGFAPYVKVDAQPVVPSSATEGNATDGNRDSTGPAVSPNPGMPPAKEDTVATVANPFRLANAAANIPAPSAYSSGLMIATTPANVVPHRFFDRENLIGTAIHAAVRTADAVQTCMLLGRGAREAWLPMKGCPAIAAYSFSMIPAQIGNSYLMHRSGHHKLERWMPYLWSAPSAAGIAVSLKSW